MITKSLNTYMDFIGITASTLCAIHCALTPLLLSILPLMSAELIESPAVEHTLIFFSMIIALISMGIGYFGHHKKIQPAVVMIMGFCLILIARWIEQEYFEIVFSAAGGIGIAVSHYKNWQCCKACYCCN